MSFQSLCPTIILGIASLLAAAVAILLVTEPGRLESRQRHAAEFQRLVGGLGFGPAADWSRCGHSFDARFCDDCQYDGGPLPSRCFCPQHTGSVFHIRQPTRAVTPDPFRAKMGTGDRNASLP